MLDVWQWFYKKSEGILVPLSRKQFFTELNPSLQYQLVNIFFNKFNYKLFSWYW